jgi:hypothetical protein
MRSARLKQSRKWEYLWKDGCEGHNVDLQQLLNLKWILIFSNIRLEIKKLLCHPKYQITRFWKINAPISYQFASVNNASNYHYAWVLIFDNTHLLVCQMVSFWNIISCFIFYSQWTKHAIVNYFLVLSLSLSLSLSHIRKTITKLWKSCSSKF